MARVPPRSLPSVNSWGVVLSRADLANWMTHEPSEYSPMGHRARQIAERTEFAEPHGDGSDRGRSAERFLGVRRDIGESTRAGYRAECATAAFTDEEHNAALLSMAAVFAEVRDTAGGFRLLQAPAPRQRAQGSSSFPPPTPAAAPRFSRTPPLGK